MSKSDLIPMNGVVSDVHAGFFSVALERGDTVKVKLSGKLRKDKIRIVANDKVTVSFSAYDPINGLITKRL